MKMMIGDRAKFIGILFGLTFATFIITQQAGIFVGIMMRTYGFVTDTSQPDIWVMDRKVQYIDDIKPMKETELFRVRGIEGIEWAVPLFKGLLKARLFPSGNFQICNVIGIDDATLIGGPPIMLQGQLRNLRFPDGVIVNDVGANIKLSSPAPNPKDPNIPLKMGDVFEINDHRAKVVGICQVGRTFQSQPVIYTTFNRTIEIAPRERRLLSFIIVKAKPGIDLEDLCQRITNVTGLAAHTRSGFKKLTVDYYLWNTGIPINFGIAVLLGFIIGTAIAGQTFYNFAHDNLRFFATFKAMGATNQRLAIMVMLQALMVATLGFSFGIGLTSLFGIFSSGTELSFKMPWWLFLISAFSIYMITIASALASLLKIIKTEPAIVFQS